jgi:hypothetical protein
VRYTLTLVFVSVVAACWHASAEEKKPDLKKVAAAKLAAFTYPGSKAVMEGNLGAIAHVDLATADGLEKVEGWYRKVLSIDKAFVGGVASLPWPGGVRVTEAKGQQQWALFRDDVRPKLGGGEGKTVRAGSTRSIVARTPEHTLFVVLNRGPADNETMISVVFLQEIRR